MEIEKIAIDDNMFRKKYYYYDKARYAFKEFLSSIRFEQDEIVLLPAYIGWSPLEGSGVFDPIKELNLKYKFYKVNKSLNIDICNLEEIFKTHKVKVFVIIHYFGYIDEAYNEAIELAKKYGAYILEDEAHAMYTDLIGGISGRQGDAAIFSLHKMLPVSSGGLLAINNGNMFNISKYDEKNISVVSPWDYDLKKISSVRRENAVVLTELISTLKDDVEPLRPLLKEGEIPQTLPVVIKNVSRDKLYFKMNELGYGVVSLYHTMIEEISKDDFKESYWLSRRIMNLPIHQDVDATKLENMVDILEKCINELKEESDM